jgi:hypothetical protein
MKTLLLSLLLSSFLLAARADVAVSDVTTSFPENELLKATPRSVFVAFMGDFRNPSTSGNWGAWAWKGHNAVQTHQPDTVDSNGRKDISSCFYPAIGVYDMSDPDVAEYHCQLLKMAGVDGISFNLAYYDKDSWRQKSMKNYLSAMLKYGLKGIVRFENKFYAKDYPDPQKCLEASYADMDAWLKFMDPVQFRVAGRPLFTLFTFKLTPDELAAWKDKYPMQTRPLIITWPKHDPYHGVVDGVFGKGPFAPDFLTDHPPYIVYVTPSMALANAKADLSASVEQLRDGQYSYFLMQVCPGFDSIGCWGWGLGPRKVERDDGSVYRASWKLALDSGFPAVTISTWNDWEEGTQIEPAVEYGDQYLAETRDGVARFKGVAPTKGNLMMPVWIYKIRKSTSDPAAIAAMNAASQLIAEGKYGEAEAMVKPWADKLNVDKLQVWNP